MESRDKNTDKDFTNRGDHNQRVGRELYERDQEHHQARHHDRGHRDIKWDERNHFHTGPSERGAQDRDSGQRYNSSYGGGASNSSYNQGENAHLQDHYGSRQNSAYRNERSILNHGNQRSSNQQQYSQGNREHSNPGNFNELNDTHDSLYREGPGSRSRYKESDYRYGSGSHNWYREGRYTPDEDRNRNDDRGFFERTGDSIRNTWNDIMHSDDAEYQQRHPRHQQPEKGSDRVRMGSEPFRDRQFDRGYEGGPRWADKTDSGHDDRYNDTDRNQRYRR